MVGCSGRGKGKGVSGAAARSAQPLYADANGWACRRQLRRGGMDVDGGGLVVVVLDLNGEKRGRVARRLRLEELAAIGQDSWDSRQDEDALPPQLKYSSLRPEFNVMLKKKNPSY